MADPATIALFNTALDRIEKVARVAPAEGDDLAIAFVYSGGSFPGDTPQRQIPAIHLTAAAAVDDWQEYVASFLRSERADTFRFAEVPKLEKLIMTETGEEGAQRLTATRYGVTSKIAVLSRDNLIEFIGPGGVSESIAVAMGENAPVEVVAVKPARRRKR